jgi:hypothetical protein
MALYLAAYRRAQMLMHRFQNMLGSGDTPEELMIEVDAWREAQLAAWEARKTWADWFGESSAEREHLDDRREAIDAEHRRLRASVEAGQRPW